MAAARLSGGGGRAVAQAGVGTTGSAAERDGLIRPLLDTPDLFLGEFRCPPSDELWSRPNNIGAAPHVVFPLRTVMIERDGYSPVCADRNTALLYEANEQYRRVLVDPAGDGCAFVALTPQLLGELAPEHRPLVRTGYLPVPARAWLCKQIAVVRARSGAADPLLLEELLVVTLGAVLGQVDDAPGAQPPYRTRVEAAKQLLGQDLQAQLSIASLARSLFVSPYHLARQFRALTGGTIHGYRTSLRLRAATQVLLDSPSLGLADIATAHGFATHSHFTRRFTAAFGMTPTFARRQLTTKAVALVGSAAS